MRRFRLKRLLGLKKLRDTFSNLGGMKFPERIDEKFSAVYVKVFVLI